MAAGTLVSSVISMMVIVSAVIGGVAVLLAGNLPWVAVLAPLNLRVASGVPWAILPMALYLYLYWRYIGGRLGAPSTAGRRREYLRANAVPATAWPLAIATGLVGFGALFALLDVMARVTTMPGTEPIQVPEGIPRATVFTLLTMSSAVAGITEEAGFRGYMQGPIERRHGLAIAILVNGTMFGLLHFPNHPNEVLSMLPYYIAVSAVYGGVTWATNSILPAVALHAGGDVWSLTRLWATGRPEWQLSATPPALVWTTGITAGFLGAVGLLVALAVVTAVLCRWLRRVVESPGPRLQQEEG